MRRDSLVGEVENAQLVYIGATSRKLDEPINIMPVGSSISGDLVEADDEDYRVGECLSV